MPPDRIGLLIPEFPGQTHIFFWREIQALAALGVRADVVSTRLPPAALIAHSWSDDAIRKTTYLIPPSLRMVGRGIIEFLRAGPGGWWRVIRAWITGESKLRRLATIPLAAVLAGEVRRHGWPHIHAHSCANAADLALFMNLFTGRPYSITLHGPLSDYGPNQKQKWRHAAFAIVITRQLETEVRTGLAGNLPPRIALAPMGVELDRFRRSQPYQPWNGSGPARVFSCGRLNPCKGHDDLIRAAAALKRIGIDAEVRIAGQTDSGQPEYRDELLTLAQSLGIADRVVLLGAIAEEQVRDELERAHVFALGSLAEPLGVAIMEAMAMEAPVVVTGAGGVPELVRDGADGLLVPPRDPERFAERIAEVLSDPALARRLATAARRTVEERFHSGVSAKTLLQQIALTRSAQPQSASSP